ncbi:MAG: hypothetical protein IPM82_29575 [Saprospiraceae bacterium]|nr:hypothetical protein [Saprospiraceae bacterium]
MELTGCTFTANQAYNGGGLGIGDIQYDSSRHYMAINNCDFIQNTAQDGGGIYSYSTLSDIEILNSNFISNYSPNQQAYSAASISYFQLDAFDLNVSNCYFGFNNSMDGPILGVFGGYGDYVGSATLNDNIFEHNSGGIYSSRFGHNTIDNCFFNENNTDPDFTFILFDVPTSSIVNSVFSNNKGTLFSQINPDALDTIANCTFYNNTVETPSSLGVDIAGNTRVVNSIFHQEIEGTAFPFLSTGVNLENSLILSPDCSGLPSYVTCGPGNIFGLEPLFADTAAGDFHLLPTSPGINAGNNDIVNALGLATDLDGNPVSNSAPWTWALTKLPITKWLCWPYPSPLVPVSRAVQSSSNS